MYMPTRCPNGTRRNKSTGNCERHNKTAKSRKSPKKDTPPPPPAPFTRPSITFRDFCKISSELYGLTYGYFWNHCGDMRTVYHVYNRNKPKFIFPKDLKKIMIGTPAEHFQTRVPYTGKAIRNKNGISANVVLKDLTRNQIHGIA